MKNSALKYKSIHETLRTEILNNKYKENEMFPTEGALMERFGASRTTIRNALNLLREEELIESRRGFGTMVKQANPSSFIQSSSMTYIENAFFHYNLDAPAEEKVSEAIIDIIPVNQMAAAALEIPAGTSVYRIRWLQSVNNITCKYMTNIIRADLVPDLEKRLNNSFPLYRFLHEEYGLNFTNAKEDVEPICASFVEARFLDVEVGKPLFKLYRTSYEDTEPIEYSITVINPDIYNLSLSIRPQTMPPGR
ncbi:MAG: GntR family transcriptional regulator [Lachnospiraceae bacterium]|nr:GntR family transcriptional regulator [Lachnospiraceae bacterium]